jgi:hypothetical protein
MIFASSFLLALQEFVKPSYFDAVAFALIALGAVGWLVAAVIGFSRARAFGVSARWFALSAACLLLYHVQLVVVVLVAAAFNNFGLVLSIGAFFNLFIVLGAVCAIIGFVRLTNPR